MNINNRELVESLENYYKRLGLLNVDKHVKRRLTRVRSKRIVSFIKNTCETDFSISSVLDIGSGWGEFLVTLKEMGTRNIYGIEPDQHLVTISNYMVGSDVAAQGFAEDLPFNSNTFDLVICNDVIEHVMNCDIAVAEMIRVTKVGGTIWFGFPNYAYPQEGHYKTLFPPYAPKWFGSLYLRIIGRDPSFYRDNVRPTYYHKVMTTLSLFNISWIDVHDKLNDIEPSKGLKAILKRCYTHFSGPPASSLLITKNAPGLKMAPVEFVKGNRA